MVFVTRTCPSKQSAKGFYVRTYQVRSLLSKPATFRSSRPHRTILVHRMLHAASRIACLLLASRLPSSHKTRQGKTRQDKTTTGDPSPLPYERSMEGRGVVNYSTDKSSFAFSTATTEFDDEIVRRGIVSFEDVMMRKGASTDEANRLGALRKSGVSGETGISANSDQTENCDEKFLLQYREKRLQELKAQHGNMQFGEVFQICRPEWTREVNEASQKIWVIVTLTSTNSERTGSSEAAVICLAKKFQDIKFVMINYQSAIPNWPEDELPTIFAYKNGVMQHQLVRLPVDISASDLESSLGRLGVLQADLQEHPSKSRKIRLQSGYPGTTFGGAMKELSTRENEDDYDDVD